jgi:hypothetical protein
VTTATKRVAWKHNYGCVGVKPDGREVLMGMGNRVDMLRLYALAWNHPDYDSVHVRNLDDKPIQQEAVR